MYQACLRYTALMYYWIIFIAKAIHNKDPIELTCSINFRDC